MRPKILQTFSPLQISYKYNDPISLPICNYASFLKNLTIEDFKSILGSACDLSPYNYIPHGHIITGNLDFIENVDLEEVLSYGCEYRSS